MSYYIDRWLLFGKETTWGQGVTPNTFPNYVLEWSATTTENKSEEDIIGGARDYRKLVWLEEGVVGRWLQEVVSAKIYEYILGQYSTADTVAPFRYTYSPASQVPSMTIYRGLYPDEAGNTISLEYYGMKVDTSELTIEQGADLRLEVNFAGKNPAVVGTDRAKPSLDLDLEQFSFHHSKIEIIKEDGSTITCTLLVSLSIATNNNLEARYSGGAATYRPVELKEGLLEVSGRLVMGGQFEEIAKQVIGRKDNTITVNLVKTGHTIDITLRNVTFGELPDEITGLEPIEMDLPYTCRPKAGSDVMTIVETVSKAYTDLPY